jgi:hypothetical protein
MSDIRAIAEAWMHAKQAESAAIDGDLAQEIAAENGLTEHLATLFRWSPELNLKAWAHASPEITGPLSAAITAKPGRPSFTITQE